MSYEYYFINNGKATKDTWIHFLQCKNNGTLYAYYTQLKNYSWYSDFGFNPNGEAFYISEDGLSYHGVWFEIEERRIAVFDYECC